jgi:iron complex outermembrane recepter protein
MTACSRARAFSVRASVLILAVLALTVPVAARAQAGPSLEGRITSSETGQPVPDVRISIAGTRLSALSAVDGIFIIRGVPAGKYTLQAEHYAYRTASLEVEVGGAGGRADLELEPRAVRVAEVVVTASREAQHRAETAATVNVIGADELRRTRPSHPSEVMNRMPGVWVNVTGGEGHMAAIRQPKTTNPVYLYLENGVPTRSTGFFNHNALYEINVPQAERIEVLKGPATALYGSDAIGGTINVLTRAPRDTPPLQFSAEAGAHGFARVLGSTGWAAGSDGIMAELNATRTDGWRDGTAYDRQSGTVRWDRSLSPTASLRTTATFSRVDQATAGSSAISRVDYMNTPEVNYTPISYRKVHAFRASAAYEQVRGSTSIGMTPFVRWNRMEMLPNWSLTYDPAVSETGHASAGALLKVRRDVATLRARVITGLDLDYSPGVHREWAVMTVRAGDVFTDYTRGDAVYDYSVTFWSASPYVQLEASPVDRLRVIGGLRYDAIGYDYDNPMGELQTGSHRRPGSAALGYRHLSPKLGFAYALSDAASAFANYSHGFRAPSEGQLFRQGRANSTLDLDPVKADSYELGARVVLFGRLSVEGAAYHMRKTDDLLGYTRPDGSTETINAGETLHRGVEVGGAVALPFDVQFDAAYSRARHTYVEWSTRDGVSFDGREMEDAPRHTGSVALTWTPRRRPGMSASIESQFIGAYWMDPLNTHRYDGHALLNLRAELPVAQNTAVFARVTNVLDERYAENAQYTTARGEQFAPGMPRALYLGVQYR